MAGSTLLEEDEATVFLFLCRTGNEVGEFCQFLPEEGILLGAIDADGRIGKTIGRDGKAYLAGCAFVVP